MLDGAALLTSPTPGVPFVSGLAGHGARTALVTDDERLTYAELASRVEETTARLGAEPRLVTVAAANDVRSLVWYLAALHGGHPVMLAGADGRSSLDRLVDAYDPDVVVTPEGPVERRAGSSHELHPDLALLLSTSGSTGSPKLVRLSHANLQSNAEAIAGYLGLGPTDRAITTLPMHYCYGLSVINSHLLRGAGIVLSGLSVVDRCFWDRFAEHGVTSLAGVPYTFDLLDRVGFESMSLPRLRFVTQAGGRLAPDRVRRYAELGRRRGWRFFVMYGQTEATARMAYLPPELAVEHPGAIGVPIAGGSFELAPVDDGGDPAEGELVYRGPNVMLGYAEHPGDLALGRTVDALRTGDIARRDRAGLYEVVGRRSRFVKPFGLRIDLQQVEHVLHEHGLTAWCSGDDTRLLIAVEQGSDDSAVRTLVRRHFGLPPAGVVVCPVKEPPRLPNGKPDYEALRALAVATEAAGAPSGTGEGDGGRPVRALFAEVFPHADVDDGSTFVSLGGDSLSYVELSIRLEAALGVLPRDWHTTPVRRLEPSERAPAQPRRVLRRVETNVVLRAAAIVLIVGSHARLFDVRGGAHVLLAVAGFNFARFQLSGARDGGTASLWASVTRIVVPSVGWIGLLLLTTDDYDLANLLLVNSHVGSETWGLPWRYWYIEALVHILVVLGALLAFAPVRRLEQRRPFASAVGLTVAAVALRVVVVDVAGVGHRYHRPQTVLWLFAIGWVAARATSVPQRAALTALVVLSVPSYYGNPVRESVVLAGLLLLTWLPRVALPAAATRLVGPLAGASLYVYLTHWQVYPTLLPHVPAVVAVAAALVGGIAAWLLAQWVVAGGRRLGWGRQFPARRARVGEDLGDGRARAHGPLATAPQA